MSVPDGLGERGRGLWLDLGEDSSQTPSGALALEACRLADRLDGLDGVIAGKGVLHLMHFRHMFDLDDQDTRVIELKVDNALSEARQQQLAFARVLMAHKQMASDKPAKGVSFLDDLERRRKDRESAASAS